MRSKNLKEGVNEVDSESDVGNFLFCLYHHIFGSLFQRAGVPMATPSTTSPQCLPEISGVPLHVRLIDPRLPFTNTTFNDLVPNLRQDTGWIDDGGGGRGFRWSEGRA